MPSILSIQGSYFGRRFEIGESLSFGRSEEATLQLTDLQVSRTHAVIRREQGRFLLLDASSRNGTRLNGEQVDRRAWLASGDVISIGSSRFVFDAQERLIPSHDSGFFLLTSTGPLSPDPEREPAPTLEVAGLRTSLLEGVDVAHLGSSDEITLASALLPGLIAKLSAERGVLVARHADDQLEPLCVSPPCRVFPLHEELIARVLEGRTLLFRGALAMTQLEQGHRLQQVRDLSVMAVPWRIEGGTAGFLWLERSAAEGPFVPVEAEALSFLLHLLAPALENARRSRLARRRSRAFVHGEEAERVPVSLLLQVMGLKEAAQQHCLSADPLILSGPHGIGKVRVARWIHRNGPRGDGPFLRVNCAQTGEKQLRNELFGLEAGVLPGVEQPAPGRLELADGGTLVLERIEALQAPVQATLMRALVSRQVQRQLGDQQIPIDVRLIATTELAVSELLSSRRLRPDLITILARAQLELPPLRTLEEGLLPLLFAIMGRANVRLARRIRGVSAKAEQLLLTRPWRHQLQELEDVVFRAMALSEGEVLTAEDLELACMEGGTSGSSGTFRTEPASAVEARLLEHALRLARGRKAEAARLMGISLEELQRKLELHKLDQKEPA